MSAQTPAPFRVGQRVRRRENWWEQGLLEYVGSDVGMVRWETRPQQSVIALDDLIAADAPEPTPATLRDVQARLAALHSNTLLATLEDIEQHPWMLDELRPLLERAACALRERGDG